VRGGKNSIEAKGLLFSSFALIRSMILGSSFPLLMISINLIETNKDRAFTRWCGDYYQRVLTPATICAAEESAWLRKIVVRSQIEK
jgi:hypothetical protein